MNINSARLFVSLLEHIIDEDSSSINQLQGVPGAVPLLKKLHQQHLIPDDQKYEPIKKVPWSDLKDNRYILLLAGLKGAGVLQSRSGDYELYAWNTDDNSMESKSESHGGRSIEWFQERIGKINRLWLGKELDTVAAKRKQRAAFKTKDPGEFSGGSEFARAMLKRFKPLWLRSLVGAQNDVKGWVNTQIKNHAFDKAKTKIDHLKNLEHAVDAVESGTDLGEISMVAQAIMHAVNQTTHMYYPEETGGFGTTNFGYRGQKPDLVNREVVGKLFDDINNGDTQKLGTLLSFFRKNLVTG
jgi:hypothetical protein